MLSTVPLITKFATNVTPRTNQKTKNSISSKWIVMATNGSERVDVKVTSDHTFVNKVHGSMRSFDNNSNEEDQQVIMVKSRQFAKGELNTQKGVFQVEYHVWDCWSNWWSIQWICRNCWKCPSEGKLRINLLEVEIYALRKEIARQHNGDAENVVSSQRSWKKG